MAPIATISYYIYISLPAPLCDANKESPGRIMRWYGQLYFSEWRYYPWPQHFCLRLAKFPHSRPRDSFQETCRFQSQDSCGPKFSTSALYKPFTGVRGDLPVNRGGAASCGRSFPLGGVYRAINIHRGANQRWKKETKKSPERNLKTI